MKTIALLALIGICAPAAFAAQTYKDVPKDHWAAESIQMVSSAGIMKGTPSGKFEPDKTVTRAELAVALAAMVQYIRESRKPILPAKPNKPATKPDQTKHPSSQPKPAPAAAHKKPPPKTPAKAISFLKNGGYLPKNSPILKGGNQKITPDELADALSSITTRLIELDVPAKSDVD